MQTVYVVYWQWVWVWTQSHMCVAEAIRKIIQCILQFLCNLIPLIGHIFRPLYLYYRVL